MMKILTSLWMGLLTVTAVSAQTLEECQQAAERNYPLIRQYDLIGKTTDLTVANIGKGWLPQVSATAQATYQSDVVSWPDQMQSMYQQMGISLQGLKKDQYKIGIDVNQVVYDGGSIKSQQGIARAEGKVQEAQTDVNMYQVRKRVNEMYFSTLLLDKQIELNADLQSLLLSTEQKLLSMYEHGTAAQCDYERVKAERLLASQQSTSLQSQRRSLLLLLSTFCGMEVTALSMPPLVSAPMSVNRPELRLAEARIVLADARERVLNSALMPKLSVFASGYYGYPGYNMFEDMMHHRWSWNGMVGARLSWNIGALYSRKNDKSKIQLQRESAANSRDVFVFNNDMEQLQQREDIERYRQLMLADDEIIALRSSVRKASESKLSHGIIDVSGLMQEINTENTARVNRAIHEIEMLRDLYELKYTTNQ